MAPGMLTNLTRKTQAPSNMSDRANIRFKHHSGQIYLYSRWDGLDLAKQVQAVFRRCRSLWQNPAACTAFVAGKIMQANGVPMGGYSLAGDRVNLDNDHDLIEFDFREQIVRLRSKIGFEFDNPYWEEDAPTLRKWSFEEFADETAIHVLP